jgi:hypothetical protein
MEGALSIEIFLQVLCDDNCGAAVEARFARFSHDDWEALYSFGSDNGLLPAFCARLSALKLQNIPAEFSSRLKNLYISNLKKNLILEQELFKALASFRENNIPVIPLKGPALAQFLYDDAALRRAPCDLDLLVRPEKFAEAEGALNKRTIPGT